MNIKPGDYVYRPTINRNHLVRWKVMAKRGWWIFSEYYLSELELSPHTLVVDKHRNLFKVPEQAAPSPNKENES